MKSKFLQVGLKAVKNAEKVLLKYYYGNQRMKLKADQTPVTIADKEAERVIIKTIKQVFPDHGFLGEESGQQKSKSVYTWIIDPIDGTKNYTRHVPMFGTLLALAENKEIILGVSNVPLMKELMYAEKGQGAFLNGKRVRASSTVGLSESYISFGGIDAFIETGRLNALLKLCLKSVCPRSISDLWAYHLLAQGKADIVTEARLNIWDIAAPSIIVNEAGGRATDFKDRLININSREIVATNKKLHKKVLSYFKKS